MSNEQRVIEYLEAIAEANVLLIEIALEDFKRTHGEDTQTDEWHRRFDS